MSLSIAFTGEWSSAAAVDWCSVMQLINSRLASSSICISSSNAYGCSPQTSSNTCSDSIFRASLVHWRLALQHNTADVSHSCHSRPVDRLSRLREPTCTCAVRHNYHCHHVGLHCRSTCLCDTFSSVGTRSYVHLYRTFKQDVALLPGSSIKKFL